MSDQLATVPSPEVRREEVSRMFRKRFPELARAAEEVAESIVERAARVTCILCGGEGSVALLKCRLCDGTGRDL